MVRQYMQSSESHGIWRISRRTTPARRVPTRGRHVLRAAIPSGQSPVSVSAMPPDVVITTVPGANWDGAL